MRKHTKIFIRGIAPALKKRLENYSLTLDEVTFDKLKKFGERLDSIKIPSQNILPKYINANANVEIEEKKMAETDLQRSRSPIYQKEDQNSTNFQRSIKCRYCQKLGHKIAQCR